MVLIHINKAIYKLYARKKDIKTLLIYSFIKCAFSQYFFIKGNNQFIAKNTVDQKNRKFFSLKTNDKCLDTN